MEKLPQNSYIVSPLLTDQRMWEWGVNLSFTPSHFYNFTPSWKPNAAQKDVRVLRCIFVKKILSLQPHSYKILPPLAAQLLHHLTPSILYGFSSHTWKLPVLNPQPLYPQLRRPNPQAINAFPTLDGLYKWIIVVRIAPSQQIKPSLLHRFIHSEQITPSL